MRLVYLDEAGTEHKSTVVCVAGVVVHGDAQWPEINERIAALIEKYVAPESQEGFIFHATDIYHGARYFDRRKPEWANREMRNAILEDLADIIVGVGLPVVMGKYERGMKYEYLLKPDTSLEQRTNLLHQMSAADCLSQTDKWLGKYAPNELATVVHEDGTSAKSIIKRTVRALRSPGEMARSGVPLETQNAFNLPLKRIIDTVHFVEKADARPLQLADLCAFTFSRILNKKSVPPRVATKLVSQITWVADPSLLPPREEEAPG